MPPLHHAFLIAAALSLDPLPDPVGAPPDPAPNPAPSPSHALSALTPAARKAANARFHFVYKLPDGSIWDSFYYIAFRKVLAEYDELKKGSLPSKRCAAWGFTTDHRAAANSADRPSPLWHTLPLNPQSPAPAYTPFIYINTNLLSLKDKSQPMLQLGKEVAPRIYEFTFKEYPASQDAFATLPCSINFGNATGIVRVPPDITSAAPNKPIAGEYFLLPDTSAPSAPATPPADPQRPRYRLIRAADLHVTADKYADALLSRRAELVEWSWKRIPAALPKQPDTYTWTRTVIDTGPAPSTAPSP